VFWLVETDLPLWKNLQERWPQQCLEKRKQFLWGRARRVMGQYSMARAPCAPVFGGVGDPKREARVAQRVALTDAGNFVERSGDEWSSPLARRHISFGPDMVGKNFGDTVRCETFLSASFSVRRRRSEPSREPSRPVNINTAGDSSPSTSKLSGSMPRKNLRRAWTPRAPSTQQLHPCQPATRQARYTIINVLGVGAFGKVFLAERMHPPQHRRLVSNESLGSRSSDGNGSFRSDISACHPRPEVVALKAMNKMQLNSRGLKRDVERELAIMKKLRSCPFIEQVFDAFQNSTHVFLELEFCQGGEFFSWMKKRLMSVQEVQFYLAEIATALDFMHKQGIFYGDLKAENLALDSKGHIKFLDFGLSRDLFDDVAAFPDRETGKPHIVVQSGSLYYASPEQLLRKPTSFEADFWALGCLLFECFTGNLPFEDVTAIEEGRPEDPQMVSEIICVGELVLTGLNELTGCPHAESLIHGFLTKDPKKRLGAGGLADIKRHEFFQLKSEEWWERIEQNCITPPINPGTHLLSDKDASNFSREFTEQSCCLPGFERGRGLQFRTPPALLHFHDFNEKHVVLF